MFELVDAKNNYALFIKNGQITAKLLMSCLFLARLDVIPRAMFIVDNFGIYNEDECLELERLLEIVPADLMKINKTGILNPHFPGFFTDGDLVIDDTLIEIKTVNKVELKADFRYQLILYYILHLINGVNV